VYFNWCGSVPGNVFFHKVSFLECVYKIMDQDIIYGGGGAMFIPTCRQVNISRLPPDITICKENSKNKLFERPRYTEPCQAK